MAHDDCLDHFVIVCFEKKFGGLSFWIRNFMVKSQRSVETMLFEELSYFFRKSVYFVKIGDQILIESILDLSVTKSLVTMCHKEFFYLMFIMNGKHGFLTGVRKKREEMQL